MRGPGGIPSKPMDQEIDISEILPHLYIGSHPHVEHVPALLSRGTRLIICMLVFAPQREFRQPPLSLLWLPSFDNPLLPIPVRMLQQGVKNALPWLAREESVVIYCRMGRHRSVAMCCAVLIGLGYSADSAMDLVKARRPRADPHAGHIERVIRRFEDRWRDEGSDRNL